MRGYWQAWTLAAVLAATSVGYLSAAAGPATQPPHVLELFTSQGCSSCPPADRLLAELAGDPQFIVMSLPVDYWDRLGWKDTFAKHTFTERQYAYANGRGDKQVYTPQVVVNGSEHANGASRRAIDASAETTAPLNVPVSLQRHGDDITISVGAASAAAPQATLVLLPYLASRDVAVGRGENARRKLTYTNVVRDIVSLAPWSGTPLERSISGKDYAQYDGIIVLVQTGTPQTPGAIIGAARLPLKASAS